MDKTQETEEGRALDIKLAKALGFTTWYHEGYDAWGLLCPGGDSVYVTPENEARHVEASYYLTEVEAWESAPRFHASRDALHTWALPEIERRGLWPEFLNRLAVLTNIQSRYEGWRGVAHWALTCPPAILAKALLEALREGGVK